MPRLVHLCVTAGKRAALLRQAMQQRPHLELREVDWHAWLRGGETIHPLLRPGDVLRVDSPARDPRVDAELLALGAAADLPSGTPRATAAEARALPKEKGCVRYPDQWFAGFEAALGRLRQEARRASGFRWANDPGEIAWMWDKTRTSEALAEAGISVPRLWSAPNSYEDLRNRGERFRCFLKLRTGSSASGTLAYRRLAEREVAYTTVDLPDPASGAFFNTRRIRRLTRSEEIAAVVNTLCRHRLHAEEWIPKATLGGHSWDLRLVTVGGAVGHRVARAGRSPLTNLHLLNSRLPWEAIQACVPPASLESALESASRAALYFRHCLYTGVDLAFAPGFRRHYVLEVNAFGDLLPGLLWQGATTYEAQLDYLWPNLAPLPAAATGGPP